MKMLPDLASVEYVLNVSHSITHVAHLVQSYHLLIPSFKHHKICKLFSAGLNMSEGV